MYQVDVEKYAQALIKNGLYSKIEDARAEAERYNAKAEIGLIEPLKCYPGPDVEMRVKHKDNNSKTITWSRLKD